jgi:hypothetical protein
VARRLVFLAIVLAVPGALLALTALILCRLALGPRRAAALSARLEARGIALPLLRPIASENEDAAADQPAFSHSS